MPALWVSIIYVRVTFETFSVRIIYAHSISIRWHSTYYNNPPPLHFFFFFFFETANFFNVPSNDYNMHTYVWLVFALNIIFKLVWENLPCIMLPPLSDTHSQQCLTECNIQLFYHYNKIPSPFFVPPDKNQQSAIISAKPIHSSHFF